MLNDASDVWEKVRQPTGWGNKKASNKNPTITAGMLNNNCAAISSDISYTAPLLKCGVYNYDTEPYITELQMF